MSRETPPHQPAGIGTMFAVVLALLGLMLLVLHGRQALQRLTHPATEQAASGGRPWREAR